MYELAAKAVLEEAVEQKKFVSIRIEDEDTHLDVQLNCVLDSVDLDMDNKRIHLVSGNNKLYWFNYTKIEENNMPRDAVKFYIRTRTSCVTVSIPQ